MATWIGCWVKPSDAETSRSAFSSTLPATATRVIRGLISGDSSGSDISQEPQRDWREQRWLRHEARQRRRREDRSEIAHQGVEIERVCLVVEVEVAVDPPPAEKIEVYRQAIEIGGVDRAVQVGISNKCV